MTNGHEFGREIAVREALGETICSSARSPGITGWINRRLERFGVVNADVSKVFETVLDTGVGVRGVKTRLVNFVERSIQKFFNDRDEEEKAMRDSD